MPQIAQIGEIYASQLFWLVVFFGAIFIVVGLGMLPKIQSTVDARDARIAADLKQAETARETADRLEEGYRERMDKSRAEAAKLAAEAKASAARATEARVGEADQALAGQIEVAQARIAEARTSALSEIETVAAEAAQAMIARVVNLNVDPAAARAAVQQELARG
ncbi:ATPase [Sphingomonas sinipercae]|uniref:ATP synthase subunit b n=1 Tax=Sphingomonas sinipercae TaxID=2714944 RepID=A0A6G7ZP90_9SPHN|nr:ATPase [Sphingomonas sinipercae]QIL02753.1 ATPase [Sphingomonas sinipercae]